MLNDQEIIFPVIIPLCSMQPVPRSTKTYKNRVLDSYGDGKMVGIICVVCEDAGNYAGSS